MNASALATARVRWRPSPEALLLARRALVALALFHLVAQLFLWFPTEWARTDHTRDSSVYYDALVRLTRGQDVYQPWPDFVPALTPTRFFYSPPFLLVIRPLASLSHLEFVHAWMILMFGAFWAYAFCLARLAKRRWNWQGALVIGMLINTLLDGYTALGLGQAEPLMWMLFGLALTTRHRAGLSGWAMLIKIHPIWVLSLALLDGKTRAWKSLAGFVVPVLALSWVLVGTYNWALWWPSVQPVASQGTFATGNWSLSFAGVRLLHLMGWVSAQAPLPAGARAYLSLCAVGAPLGMALLARRASPELRLSLVACAGMLFAPLCWGDYSPLFLLPVCVWMGERRAHRYPKQTFVARCENTA